MGDSEASVASKVLKIYKRLVTYRPHLSDETHRNLVQVKLQEIYEVRLLLEEVSAIIENHPELIPFRRPVAVRRKSNEDTSCTKRSLTEPKKNFQRLRGENFPTIGSNSPCRHVQDSEDALNCKFTNSNSVEIEDVAESTIPGPVAEDGNNDGGEKKQKLKIYEVYQHRMPYNLIVKQGQVVLNIWNTKRFVHERFSKKNKKEDLNDYLSISVVERLYAQRKQRNTKKPADIRKWELHMKKWRDETLKIQQNRIQSLSANRLGSFSADTCIHINDENVSSEDEILLISLSGSAESCSPTQSAEADNDNTTNFSLRNVYRLLEELTLRFNAHIGLCQCKEIDVLQ